MYGWMGSMLRIDLSRGKPTVQPLDPVFAKKFLGGRGFNSRVLWKEIRPGTDPFSPENVLCIAPGMLTGTPLALTGRVSVSTLSPLTSILGDGSGGGEFAWQMKRAGFDQVVVTGRAEKPNYLLLDDGKATLLDASSLAGLDTWETTELLEETHGKGISVACIGQAGEQRVRFASMIFDRYSSAAPGSGAVMGSKNLKAVVARGTRTPALADPDGFRELAREDRRYFREDPFFRDQVGKTGSLVGVEDWGPGFRNSQARWSGKDVPGDLRTAAWKKFEIGRTGCHGCPVRCKNVFRIPSGNRAGERGEGLEYEAIHWLGINSGILDPVAILEMSNLADRYGMDVIALGSVIAYAKELFSRGLLTTKETGGLFLAWEDANLQVTLIHMIARREGFGAVLADGMLTLAKQLGGEAEKFCFHVKGVSRGVYPANLYSLAHATSTRGADHLRGRTWALGENDSDIFADLGEKGVLPCDEVAALQAGERATTLADALGRCKGAVNMWVFAVPLVWKYPLWEGAVRIIRAATGVDFTAEELEMALDGIYLQELAFNARQGITRADDRMPQRPEVAATPEGKIDRERFGELLTRYYLQHGCDPETGVPTRERLVELGLSDVADELERLGPEIPVWMGPVG
jgi:aldehyde:ferredoxin oxidoreductase